MKLLLIGGSGQLSGRVAQLAVEAGHQVWALTRGSRPLPEGVIALKADRNNDAETARALEQTGVHWDAAIDCICMNADHARQDLQLLRQYTGRLAVVSTDSVYAPDHKQVPQTEESDHYMQDGGYGAQKRQMEETFLAAQETAIHWTLFRPGHIFGPGFKLGCFPEHSRQDGLLEHIRADRPLELVGGGAYLIHPIFVDDMALCLLDCLENPHTFNQIFCVGGPDVITNAAYYQCIGRLTGHPVTIHTIPEEGYLQAHPEYSGHLCQRCYSLQKLLDAGVRMPSTTLEEGLRRQIQWLDSLS